MLPAPPDGQLRRVTRCWCCLGSLGRPVPVDPRVVEDDPAVADELIRSEQPAWEIGPKGAVPISWGWSATPGIDQAPLCTSGEVMVEQTVVWRWARSVWARCSAFGHRAVDHRLGGAGVDRERACGPVAEAERHVEGRFARRQHHGERHRGPGLAVGDDARRERDRRARAPPSVPVGCGAFGTPEGQGLGRSRSGRHRIGSGHRSRGGPPAGPSPRSRAASPPSAICGVSATPAADQAGTATGWAVPTQPTPANSLARTAVRADGAAWPGGWR